MRPRQHKAAKTRGNTHSDRANEHTALSNRCSGEPKQAGCVHYYRTVLESRVAPRVDDGLESRGDTRINSKPTKELKKRKKREPEP